MGGRVVDFVPNDIDEELSQLIVVQNFPERALRAYVRIKFRETAADRLKKTADLMYHRAGQFTRFCKGTFTAETNVRLLEGHVYANANGHTSVFVHLSAATVAPKDAVSLIERGLVDNIVDDIMSSYVVTGKMD